MSLFYAPNISDDECVLSEEEAGHALKVLRLSEGDEMQITDGQGNRYAGVLASSDIRNCKVDNLKKLASQSGRSYELHIAIAPTKNNSRLEWFLEKACEIGIDTITPIICDHSERRKLQSERLEKILIGAMKQSDQDILPRLEPVTSLENFLSETEFNSKNTFMASHEDNNQELVALLNDGNSLVLIGPEGDFSDREKKLAKDKSIQLVNLGGTRLRTETAGLVAVHTVALINAKSNT